MENRAGDDADNYERKYMKMLAVCNYRDIKKGTVIHVTGRGGPQGCETSRLPHFLDNQLTDGGEVVSPRQWPPAALYSQEDSWYSFLSEY
jgi:hypothetical protein